MMREEQHFEYRNRRLSWETVTKQKGFVAEDCQQKRKRMSEGEHYNRSLYEPQTFAYRNFCTLRGWLRI